MTRLRSIVFVGWFYLVSTILALLYCATLVLPRRGIMWGIWFWSQVTLFGLRWIVDIRVEIRGLEYCPKGAALVASKHQGLLDTIALLGLMPDPCFVLKKELMRLPLFGWHATTARMIPIDREAHSQALRNLVRTAKAELHAQRQIIIFPEGTRRAPGAPPDYKPGVAALYRDLGLACTPVATNSGVHWPARGVLRRPGTVVFEFLPPIQPGLKRGDFMRQLQDSIERASAALL